MVVRVIKQKTIIYEQTCSVERVAVNEMWKICTAISCHPKMIGDVADDFVLN